MCIICKYFSKNKTDLVKMLRTVGGRTTPSSLPKLNEKPDPMLSEPPPWGEEKCNGINLKTSPCNENLERKRLKDLENNDDGENDLLYGKITTIERVKIFLPSILSKKNKNSFKETRSISLEETQQENNSFFKLKSEKLQISLSNLLKRKKKQKTIYDKKSFVKVWLQDASGHSLNLYAFRKEE